jgi:excisionase family DNA binding protein
MRKKSTGIARLLRVRQVAELLGLAERTVWGLIASGRLTPIRLGARCTRVDAAEVEALIEAARSRAGS